MKILIIRFSSIGDLTQALSLPGVIKSYHPQAEIHFVTRSDLASLVENHPDVTRLWTLDRKLGFKGSKLAANGAASAGDQDDLALDVFSEQGGVRWNGFPT